MRISDGYSHGRQSDNAFDRMASREERRAERQQDRQAERAERKADRQEARQAERAERKAKRDAMRPSPRPMPVEPDGGIGDGAGPIPFPPEATTLAVGEEDGGAGGPFPIDPDGPFPIGGKPIPVEPDGGIGDGAGPIPIDGKPIPVEPDGGIGDGAGPIPFPPPDATTLALGEEDGGFPFDPPGPIGGPKPTPWPFPLPRPIDPIGGPEPVPFPKPWPGPIGGPTPRPIPAPQPLPIPFPPPTGGPEPIDPAPGRVPPPSATGSYRLGENSIGASFLNFDGGGGAEIIGAGGTSLRFDSIRVGEDGSIFGEGGSGHVGRRPNIDNARFKLSIAPNDAGYQLQVKAYGEKFDIQAGPNGIVPPRPIDPPIPVDPPSRGGGLLFLYNLDKNSLGATGVTLNTDGTGTITGPGVDLKLSGGGYNDAGDWVATAGSGTIDGEAVTLKQNADGNVFVASGEGGLADRVSAWIEGGRELDAEVVAVAQP